MVSNKTQSLIDGIISMTSSWGSGTSKILHHRLRIAAKPPGGTARGCRGIEMAAAVCKQADLLLKKAEQRWPERYDNDPTAAWFRQMEPKMVWITSVTKLCLKWTMRDAPRRILSKLVEYRSGRDLVHYNQVS
jgi:hypothetical protein